jgi:multiple sugar transport system substrate-binding protein
LAPGVFETTGEQRLEEFAQGKIAMMIASTRAIPYLRERMGDDAFGITTIPDSGTGGRYSAAFSAIYTGINSNSAHIDEAWSFLVFLAEKSFLFCEELKAVPGVVSDIIRGDYIKDDPFYSKAWDIFESSGIAEGFSGNPYAQEYETAFMEELQIFFETNRTAQQTVAAIQQRWDIITEEAATKDATAEETETEDEAEQEEVTQDEVV